HGLLGILEALEMGQEPARLDGDDEPVRRLGLPTFERGDLGQAVEGAVQLGRREAGGVERQPRALWQPLGIEALAPIPVLPPARADEDHATILTRSPSSR